MNQEIPIPKRLVSLDAFRGFTIISMLLVNNAGDDRAFWYQFRHAHWGEMVTFCDQIFPWFLFMVGVALPYSASSFHKKTPGFLPYFKKAFQRMVILLCFGILIDSSISKRLVIGLDVLQLIGLAYFVGAMIYELSEKKRWCIAGIFLIGYWILLRFVPIPGVGAGFFEEDKNIIHYINQYLYPWHIAGILSTIPAAALVLIGSYFGDMFRNDKISASQKLKTLFLGGILLMVLGTLWNFSIPFSKDVWSPSYILFTAGTGCIVLGVFYYIIDVQGYQKIAFPFVVYGMNAITAYFFSIMVRVHTVQEWKMQSSTGETITVWIGMLNFWQNNFGWFAGAWLFTLTYILFWWLVMYWLYRKKLFLRV